VIGVPAAITITAVRGETISLAAALPTCHRLLRSSRHSITSVAQKTT
jgi:hypothetical protein